MLSTRTQDTSMSRIGVGPTPGAGRVGTDDCNSASACVTCAHLSPFAETFCCLMDPSKWTEKTRSALNAAAESAHRAGCPQLEAVHVAIAALDDPAGVARAAVLRAAGGDDGAVQSLRRTLQRVASKLPSVRPPPVESPSASQSFQKVMQKASRKMEDRGDTFLAVDTLWLACLEDPKVRCAGARVRGATRACPGSSLTF